MINNNNKPALYKAITRRILEGEGDAKAEERRAAFDNSIASEPLKLLVNKVALHPAKITDEDIKKVITSGFSEDKIFDLIICAAVGQAARQYESALKALSEAQNKIDKDKDDAA